MGAEASQFPVPSEFGPDAGLDRSRVHDVPWCETLRALGREQRGFPIDEERLARFLDEATDDELHCCRSLFRAWRQYAKEAADGEQKEFATALYFVLAQQPQHLLQFYVMLHVCWVFGVGELALDPAVLGADFARAVQRHYCVERGAAPEPDSERHAQEAQRVRERMAPVFASIVTSYLRKLLDLLTNPEYADPVVADFGHVGAQAAHVWTLRASDGSIEARVTEYGAALVGCKVRDRTGQLLEVVLSPQSAEGLVEHKECWYGAVIGRYANRIRDASFRCDGTVYQLDVNEGGKHHLHGGSQGWGRRMWTPADATENPESASGSTVAFTLVSADGDMGYPGLLAARVEYTVRPGAVLVMRYNAQLFASRKAGRPVVQCPVNLTNHAYWRLGGAAEPTVHAQQLWVDAERHVVCDEQHLPTGELAPVAGTALDFAQTARALGPQPPFYACYCLRGDARQPKTLRRVATLHSPCSGIEMAVATTEPSLQLYTGSGDAVCLECGAYPDAPNHPDTFPSTLISSAGDQYAQLTVHTFTVK